MLYCLRTSFHSGHSGTFNILQVFSENIGKKSEPDLAKFHMTHLDDDIVALMKKRVVDMVGFLGITVQVMFNGQMFQRLNCFPNSVYPYIRTASKGREVLPRFGDSFSNKHQFECCCVCKSKLIQTLNNYFY
jgi:DNA topoisomerase-2